MDPVPAAIAMPAGLTVTRMTYGRIVLRGRDLARTAASRTLGLEIPAEALRISTSTSGTLSALWLGPDEWLLRLAPGEVGRALDLLGKALAEIPHALVDVSDRQVAFEIAGPLAQEVLAVGCPLDLDLSTFFAGTCTRTLLDKCEITLSRRSADTFHIEVGRSYEAYIVGHLQHAARALASQQ